MPCGANRSMPWWNPVVARGAPNSSEKSRRRATGNAYSPDSSPARTASSIGGVGGEPAGRRRLRRRRCRVERWRRDLRRRARRGRDASPASAAAPAPGASRRAARRAVGRRRRLDGGGVGRAGVGVAHDELGARRQAAVGARAGAGAARRRSCAVPRWSRSASTRSPTVRSPTPWMTITRLAPSGMGWPRDDEAPHDGAERRRGAGVVRLRDRLDRDLLRRHEPVEQRHADDPRRRARRRRVLGRVARPRRPPTRRRPPRAGRRGRRRRRSRRPGRSAPRARRCGPGPARGSRSAPRQRGGPRGRLRRRACRRPERPPSPRSSRSRARPSARAGGIATSL